MASVDPNDTSEAFAPLRSEIPLAADQDTEQIVHESKTLRSSRKKTLTNLLYLGFTLVLFAAWGFFEFTLTEVLLLIVVLLVHEGGHYITMRLSGYHDVQMFFIPFFGAAVSGKNPPTAGWRRTIVALMGPVPGLIVGCILGVVYLRTQQPLLSQAAFLFLALNAINLLPILPADGGHVIDTLFFSRAPRAKAVFSALSGTALVLIGLGLSDWILVALGVLLLAATPSAFRQARLVKTFRRLLRAEDVTPITDIAELPLEQFAAVLRAGRSAFPSVMDPKQLASQIKSAWESALTKAPGVLATLVLFGLYAFCLLVPVLAGFVAAMAAPPLVEDPWTYSSATMSLSYPGNWSVAEWREDHDPTANVRIEALGDAWAHIMLVESNRGIDDVLAVSRGSVRALVHGAHEGPSFDYWGRYEGQGVTLFGTRGGTPYVARIFASALGQGRFLEIQEVFAVAHEAKLSPGFELIRSTFMVKPALPPEAASQPAMELPGQ